MQANAPPAKGQSPQGSCVVVSTVSSRLPDDIEARLAAEADRCNRPKSEVARDAIGLERQHGIDERLTLGDFAETLEFAQGKFRFKP